MDFSKNLCTASKAEGVWGGGGEALCVWNVGNEIYC